MDEVLPRFRTSAKTEPDRPDETKTAETDTQPVEQEQTEEPENNDSAPDMPGRGFPAWGNRNPTGQTRQKQSKRTFSPRNKSGEMACPTASKVEASASLVVNRHPGRNEKPISFGVDTPPETIAQDVLGSCAADFKRLIARWVK